MVSNGGPQKGPLLSITVINPQRFSGNFIQFHITTVDGRNPAPPRMMIIPLFIGFCTSQVVQDFVHQQ